MRLGVNVCHGRPYHPQTQGKDERFHRTLKAEALGTEVPADLPGCQRRFDHWREVYNHERPHEALGLDVPASRCAPSPREYTGTLAPIEYGPGDAVRRVQHGGHVHFRGGVFKVSKAFRGQPVAIRPADADGRFSVHFCRARIGEIDLRRGPGSPGPRGGRS